MDTAPLKTKSVLPDTEVPLEPCIHPEFILRVEPLQRVRPYRLVARMSFVVILLDTIELLNRHVLAIKPVDTIVPHANILLEHLPRRQQVRQSVREPACSPHVHTAPRSVAAKLNAPEIAIGCIGHTTKC